MTVMLATQGMAADAPQPKKHHGKGVGVVMVVGGVALMGLSAFALSRPCPAEERASQISGLIGRSVTAGSCGSSWFEKNKGAVGASGIGAGAALAVGGFVLMHQSEHAAVPVPATLKPTPGN